MTKFFLLTGFAYEMNVRRNLNVESKEFIISPVDGSSKCSVFLFYFIFTGPGPRGRLCSAQISCFFVETSAFFAGFHDPHVFVTFVCLQNCCASAPI